MALMVCPECGKMISDIAISCPNCGAPLLFGKPKPKKSYCQYLLEQLLNSENIHMD